MALDFGAGLIRHEATVDRDGIEWSHDVVRQLGVGQLSLTGTLIAAECCFNVFHVTTTINYNEGMQISATNTPVHG